jgi:tRNA U34 5-carboxymethylaminomethyl modifying GTPase MnmE/TrmE
MTNTTWTLLTPPSQGAIAIVQLAGNVTTELGHLTGRSSWNEGSLYLVNIPDIDEAVAVKINSKLAQIMPHGGIHIMRKLAIRFDELGITQTDEPQYPEASDDIEIAMLKTLAIAKSPLAVPLLLQQPEKLRTATSSEEDFVRAAILHHLIVPPTVVLLGAPNTGKSTLMNALTKQDTSIVHHLPGATRDAVGARINCGGLVIDLYDLPGFRESDDPIEQAAIALAKTIANAATLTILIADEDHEWLETTCNSIAVATKSDIHVRADADICVSAQAGENMQELAIAIRDAIIPSNVLQSDRPWFFYSPMTE